MTKIAILGDVRANEPALLAVLARIAQLQVDRLWHVGSLLSYGPDPIAVSDYFDEPRVVGFVGQRCSFQPITETTFPSRSLISDRTTSISTLDESI